MMKTLKDIGEFSAVERLIRRLPAGSDVVVGPGDDCAVLRASGETSHDWLLTSDPVIEGVHFDSKTPPEHIGHKAIGRILSDIGAMGGEPKWALLNVVAPRETPIDTLDAVYDGASRLAVKYGLSIVGGDLAQGPVLEIHAFGIGVAPTGSALLRSGASPGELIFVTGALGGSRLGKHISFEPRVREGLWLRDRATALIDISDGLAGDLRHLINRSGVGARIHAVRIPVSTAAFDMNDGISPLDHALYDGEDFEMLFTARPDGADDFISEWRRTFDVPCSLLGVITDRANTIECVDQAGNINVITRMSYEHFSP